MTPITRSGAWLIVTAALSLSIGWGIRGNFGHEYGAMIPGALASMAAVLLSCRADWWPRTAHFGFFGALGWSFGGSISYMQVIAYTHSGHSASVLYGFACLFVIGFLWAALGGAGTAMPACLDREQLEDFFTPVTAVFVAWVLQDVVVGWIENPDARFRQASWLYWYDTDWLAALTAILAILMLALIRRRFDGASSLILHMAVGWWAGLLLLVVALGWRMTPPRGDNWAGCVGMVLGLWLFLQRRGWGEVLLSSLTTGLIAGFGFATATLLKLIEVKSGWQTNWHSVLEQTYGLINGVGLGVAVLLLSRRAPSLGKTAVPRHWTGVYATAFILLVITYVNPRKNPGTWLETKAMPAVLYGVPVQTWFSLGYLALGLAVIGLLMAHQRRPILLVPESALGKGQLLYVVFLWWMVIGNMERALPGFAPQRLITEGVIHLNAVIVTVLVLLGPGSATRVAGPTLGFKIMLRRAMVWGALGFVLSVAMDWMVVRTVWGDQFAGYANRHIRFGPDATASKAKPRPDQPHP